MEFTRSVVREKAEEYRKEEPLYAVEAEQVETLPGAFAAGEFGWRDAEWVVRWYYRRFLGAFPDEERRRVEERFEENDFDAVRRAIGSAVTADGVDVKLASLTDLAGVDVPVGSAFLFFVDPGAFVVVGEREWGVLHDAGELADPYPGSPSVTDYRAYLDTCRTLGETFDCDMWTLYRALWRLAKG